ncbi:hypothetical protein AWC30_13190 [Mycolicibacillus trivialis]|uniref:DUF3817 domain-containing protein n=1 Tax=Mycolicibacillus trivialis TaxID=1798 RepID=A0A1X2EHP4_9MYCO|nr:hypothetical protein AWC30_13190 [Mycolicibacillus trivialis]
MHLRSPRHLHIAAHVELISLIVLLANLFTLHLKPVASLIGPAHGCAYLFVVIATWRLQQAPAAANLVALVPGVGGLLALRLLDRVDTARAQPEEVIPS